MVTATALTDSTVAANMSRALIFARRKQCSVGSEGRTTLPRCSTQVSIAGVCRHAFFLCEMYAYSITYAMKLYSSHFIVFESLQLDLPSLLSFLSFILFCCVLYCALLVTESCSKFMLLTAIISLAVESCAFFWF